jgi:hypothetical protein
MIPSAEYASWRNIGRCVPRGSTKGLRRVYSLARGAFVYHRANEYANG